MEKRATAHWQGGLKDGKGTISTESGVLAEAPYGFNTRFEGVKGTNPEELVGAAHAGCFSMALSSELGKAGMKAESIDTKCTVTFEKVGEAFTVTRSHLDVTVKIVGGSAEAFKKAAETAKANCPISRLLKAEISMEARLVE